MLKCRVIPILTFNGFALVKTKQFKNPRMVGNPVQSARVFNSRNVDELAFIDIFATDQKRKLDLRMVKNVINECFMPVAIGGGISTIKDIDNLLEIGADKVIIKTKAIQSPNFIEEAARVFGSQCITIALDAIRNDEGGYNVHNKLGLDIKLDDFVKTCNDYGAGELVVSSVDNDGIMKGFDVNLYKSFEKNTMLPIIASGGGGKMEHYEELFAETTIEAVGSASIFYFTRYTPLDIKLAIGKAERPIRLSRNIEKNITQINS